MRKVIHSELCMKFKFDHTNKWYMINPETILESKTHKVPWDFEIQTDLCQVTSPNDSKKKKKREPAEKQKGG